MSISITTKDFVKAKTILIDGMEWEFIAPGAGLSLELSRLSREVNKDTTPEEQEKLLETIFEFYGSIFKDKTENNADVNKWLRQTPIETIGLVIADVQRQSE